MNSNPSRGRDAVVVGAGIGGLTAALRLARAGASVTVVSKGPGGLQLSQGTLDVLGYAPDRVARPYEALPAFTAENPEHPYAAWSPEAVRAAVDFVVREASPYLSPSSDANLQLPTAVGAIRPTAVAQPSMVAADLSGPGDRSFVVIGLRRFKDFQPGLVAGNLARTTPPGGGSITARAAWIDVEVRAGECDSGGLRHAGALDSAPFRERFAREVAGVARGDETVLLPAVLGVDDPTAHVELERLVGRPIAEVPVPPPGIPGLRLFRTLSAQARAAGVRFVYGSHVIDKVVEGDRVRSVVVDTTGHPTELRARSFVFAPGGFESGALSVDSYGRITEPALGLPLSAPSARGLINGDFWGSDQALFSVGVRTDAALRVLDADGVPVLANLHAIGGILAGASRWREKSGEGIAAASACAAADHILQEAK